MRLKVRTSLGSQLAKARIEAEKSIGFAFDDLFAAETLQYCIRKLKRIGQTESYLPLLYRDELLQHHQMKRISAMNKPVTQKGVSVCVSIA